MNDVINMPARRVFWEEEGKSSTTVPAGWPNDAATMRWTDRQRNLHFSWDGDATHNVVAAVGSNQCFSFDYKAFKPNWVIAGTKSSVLSFQEACRRWVEAKEEIAGEEGLLEAKWNNDYDKGAAYARSLKMEDPEGWFTTAMDYSTSGYYIAIASEAYKKGFSDALEGLRKP